MENTTYSLPFNQYSFKGHLFLNQLWSPDESTRIGFGKSKQTKKYKKNARWINLNRENWRQEGKNQVTECVLVY